MRTRKYNLNNLKLRIKHENITKSNRIYWIENHLEKYTNLYKQVEKSKQTEIDEIQE